MTMNDTHQPFIDQLSDYIDDELSPRERAAVDEHIAACTSCRETLAQLRTVVRAAGTLSGRLPDRELWGDIESRITTPATTVLPFGRAARRTFAFTVPQLAAAGIALMVLSGGLVHLTRSSGPVTPAAEVAGESNQQELTAVSLTDSQYDNAVGDLERTLAEGRGRLDPETVRVLEQNLETIDRAIAQSRAALEADPGNVFLNSHLISARQRKLALLRRATALTTGS